MYLRNKRQRYNLASFKDRRWKDDFRLLCQGVLIKMKKLRFTYV